MSAAMDLYLSASDSLSFQDMLDIDIKSEIETLVGANNDFSSLNFTELPPLDLDEVHDIKWFSSNSNHSSLNFDLSSSNDDRQIMVNPNAVMPFLSLTSSHSQNIRSPSPSLKESHLKFSPSAIKIAAFNKHDQTTVKKDLIKRLDDVQVVEKQRKTQPSILKTITKVMPIATTTSKLSKTSTTTILTIKNNVHKVSNNTPTFSVGNLTAIRTITPSTAGSGNNNNIHSNNLNSSIRKQQQQQLSRLFDEAQRFYPKPAYSYSCLIAMALKNSRTGSLPVSEIYNFMCRHFPYFKTAPNGWKNSVRHNLSLNKCFEKIEKPPLDGAHRKGCLWAMNPAKIVKMDEEVQKWSRKDPSAIRKAMVNPETLESLERGEMKFTCSYDEADVGGGDSCGSAAESEEGSESEGEIEKPVLSTNFVNIKSEFSNGCFKTEMIEDDFEEEEVHVSEEDGSTRGGNYDDDDLDDDQEMLRMEIALAQKDLLEYESINNKRRRTLILQH